MAVESCFGGCDVGILVTGPVPAAFGYQVTVLTRISAGLYLALMTESRISAARFPLIDQMHSGVGCFG